MDNETIISIKNYDRIIEIKHPYNDVTINELVKDFVTLMEGITFYHEQVVNAFKEYIEEDTE